ncbi:vWA domain-containing protein [Phenylobacterium sp.]|uniref:vWA domain-containing protein n=1 Tax=Phenylobacterium sp. TaxID=1871053 RepID=UPI002DEA4026|nr:vWA domain-containing protein [Phenylobacterium sp.]
MLFRRLRSALLDRRGNVAVVVALSLAPLSLAALGALDIARATAAKLELQDALDAAALATAKSTVSDSTVLQQTGDRIFRQNLALDSDVTLSSDTFTFGTGNVVVATASAAVRPLILGSITGGPIVVGAHAQVTRAGNQLEIALVLDNTGSMAGTKLSNLQTAANNFIDSMSQAATQSGDPNAIKISLVPFSNTVRIGSTFRNAAWIDQSGTSPINNQIFADSTGAPIWANRFTLLTQMGVTWAGCVESRQAPYDIQDTAPSSATPATLFTPYFAPDEPDRGGTYFNNYLPDGQPRGTSWQVRQGGAAKYSGQPDLTSGMGPNWGCTLQPMQRLTTNFSALKTAVNAMTANGDTNIPMGMMWGWHTLSPNAPLADGVAYLTAKHKKIVILMTDGQNQMTDSGNSDQSFYSGAGYAWQGRVLQASGTPISGSNTQTERSAALDDRLSKICTAMKAADKDIEIYTMRVEVVGGTSTVLQDCASGADHYFDVTNSAQLDAVFQQIAGSIAALHLSK